MVLAALRARSMHDRTRPSGVGAQGDRRGGRFYMCVVTGGDREIAFELRRERES
jgi:hypothetical protein